MTADDRSNALSGAYFLSVVEGIEWPAISSDNAAHLQCLLFQLEYSQRLTPEHLLERQLMQLKSLLRHAKTTVPHYAETFRDLDVEGLTWATFQALPLLGRKEVQTGFESLKSASIPKSHGTVTQGQSSGSTGTPVFFLQTAASQLF